MWRDLGPWKEKHNSNNSINSILVINQTQNVDHYFSEIKIEYSRKLLVQVSLWSSLLCKLLKLFKKVLAINYSSLYTTCCPYDPYLGPFLTYWHRDKWRTAWGLEWVPRPGLKGWWTLSWYRTWTRGSSWCPPAFSGPGHQAGHQRTQCWSNVQICLRGKGEKVVICALWTF